MHWLSKKKMACLELDAAWALLDQLTEMSQTSGVASDSPFHRRDASRVLALRGQPDDAATTFLQYFDLAGQQQDRAITVLACQVAELEAIHGQEAADRLLEVVSAGARDMVSDPQHQADLTAAASSLQARPAGWAVLPYVLDALGIDPNEAVAAEAIFRFDVPDLAVLRNTIAAP
jgi:uncharacterized metal-binding protein